MPYMTKKVGGKYCVFKKGANGNPEGKTLGCHGDEKDAERQVKAILAATHSTETRGFSRIKARRLLKHLEAKYD